MMLGAQMERHRGQRLGWSWANAGAGASARVRGLVPTGRLITVADEPGLTMTIGLRVDGDPSMILDPVKAIAAGKFFTLLRMRRSRRCSIFTSTGAIRQGRSISADPPPGATRSR